MQKPSLYEHMLNQHEEQLNGLSPAHVYFNFRNKKTSGLCVWCRKNPTEFNEETERYERFCSDKCKEAYKKDFKQKMMNKYGKTTLTRDPEFQKKMLKNRKISGEYTWSDGKKFTYTGSYEKDFLEYMDKIINLDSKDLFSPCPIIFDYIFNDKKHFYIPDFYVPSLNLIIEIKASDNKHYRERDLEQEKLKDKAVLDSKDKYNFYKIFDKDYKDFTIYFKNLIYNSDKTSN